LQTSANSPGVLIEDGRQSAAGAFGLKVFRSCSKNTFCPGRVFEAINAWGNEARSGSFLFSFFLKDASPEATNE